MSYFVADEIEITSSKSWGDIFLLFDKYEVIPSLSDIEMFPSLSRLFFQNEEHLPKHVPAKIHKIYADGFEIYQCDKKFIEKVALVEHVGVDSLAYIWREDDYWLNKNYGGMGIWSFLYELLALCKIAVKERKNLYFLEEKRERILEK